LETGESLGCGLEAVEDAQDVTIGAEVEVDAV